jgi:hypothetical protein
MSLYSGDDWREHILPVGKLALYRDPNFSLSLVKSQAYSYKILTRGEILVLEGELRLDTGDRIREANSYRVVDPVAATAERESVYLHLEN